MCRMPDHVKQTVPSIYDVGSRLLNWPAREQDESGGGGGGGKFFARAPGARISESRRNARSARRISVSVRNATFSGGDRIFVLSRACTYLSPKRLKIALGENARYLSENFASGRPNLSIYQKGTLASHLCSSKKIKRRPERGRRAVSLLFTA